MSEIQYYSTSDLWFLRAIRILVVIEYTHTTKRIHVYVHHRIDKLAPTRERKRHTQRVRVQSFTANLMARVKEKDRLFIILNWKIRQNANCKSS